MSKALPPMHTLAKPRRGFWKTCARLLANKVLRKAGLSRYCLAPSYNRPVVSLDKGRDIIATLLASPSPVMICRFGGVESWLVADTLKIVSGIAKGFSQSNLFNMSICSGIFPATPDIAFRFSLRMLEDIQEADCVGVWGNNFEDYLLNAYVPNAELIPPKVISPCEVSPPWSSVLKGKRVVVVHPFARSIESQFARRHSLFDDPETLPEFELVTLKAVQSIAGEKTPFPSWFEALEHMQAQLDSIDYDIALIGCGAYGLSLAAHVKRSGKKAVHIGGALQLLFGIMGKRWEGETFPTGPRFENWVRPHEDETPQQKNMVEDGCYW